MKEKLCDWRHNHPREEIPLATRHICFVVDPQETVSESHRPELPVELRLCDRCTRYFREKVVTDPACITLDQPLIPPPFLRVEKFTPQTKS